MHFFGFRVNRLQIRIFFFFIRIEHTDLYTIEIIERFLKRHCLYFIQYDTGVSVISIIMFCTDTRIHIIAPIACNH